MTSDYTAFFHRKVQIEQLREPLSNRIGTTAADEVLFHLSEILTEFNSLQDEALTIANEMSSRSDPVDSFVSQMVSWFEALHAGWTPHWQEHATQALKLLKRKDKRKCC